MNTNTPGPWMSKHIVGGNYSIVAIDCNIHVASVHECADSLDNARLVEIAPDMLAILKRISPDLHPTIEGETCLCLQCDLRRDVRELLGKLNK